MNIENYKTHEEVMSIINERRYAAETNASIKKHYMLNGIQGFKFYLGEYARLNELRLKTSDPSERKKHNDKFLEVCEILDALKKKNDCPDDFNIPVYSCQKCKDTGIYVNKKCECYKAIFNEITTRKVNQASSTELAFFDTFSFDVYKDEKTKRHMKKIYKACKEFADNFHLPQRGGLLLSGPTGLGKTHLSTAIVNEVLKKNYFPVYIKDYELMKIAYESYSFQNNIDKISKFKLADLLVIDDMGERDNNNIRERTYFEIIDERMNHRLPTIINTNLNRTHFYCDYGERIFSRVFGEFKEFYFKGDDMRFKK